MDSIVTNLKSHLAKMANSALGLFGAQIVSCRQHRFDMSSALQRIPEHGFKINTIVDIGASNGSWSTMAMRYFPECSFLAVEPLEENRKELSRLRHALPNFDYILCAAGERDDGEAVLNVTEDLIGSTIDGKNPGVPRKVPISTLDAIIREKSPRAPFMLKFDTHGYELPILSGSEDTLGRTEIIVMEVFNFAITDTSLQFYEMCSHMDSLGFRCFDLADPIPRQYDKTFWQMDLFFCRKDAPMFRHPHFA